MVPSSSAPGRAASSLDLLLLFDIDGTLIRASGAARAAFARTVQARFGVTVDLRAIDTAGKTDLAIMREILDAYGLRAAPVDDEVLDTYLRHFAQTIRADPGELCPGIPQLLQTLASLPAVRTALGTGNLEPSARLKLAAHGLNEYFFTGGFGGDGADRNAIIAAALRRCEAFYGASFRRAVVVGDTPYDVAGAQANGVHSVAVATGPYDLAALRAAGATLVFPDLSRTDEVLAALGGLPPSPHAS